MNKKIVFILVLILVISMLAAPAALADNNELPDIDIDSWEFLVANTYNSILYYAPPYGGFEGQGIDKRIFDSLTAFMKGAREAGYEAYAAATYRNFEFQYNHFIPFMETQQSCAEAVKYHHAPGTSEHQTGLGVCITNDISLRTAYYFFDNSAVEETELFDWLVEHCHEYGFILRYPEGKEMYYGTPCSGGHFRYVGVEAATYIMENDLCLEEFLLLYDEDAVFVPGLKK